ncbi:MAG TPA: phosphodiester glycosidase family protein [Clostridium sp.]
MIRNTKKSIKKTDKRFSWKLLLGFILFQLIFTVVTAPLVLLYGPFEQAKKTYVGSAMKTMSNQWLATTFLSDEKIAEIIGSNKSSGDVETQDSSLIEIPKAKDETIENYVLNDNPKFTGHVLVIYDPTRVKVGVTSKLGKEGETVTAIAERYDAVAAINGGYFTDNPGAQEWTQNGGTPVGYLMSEGKELCNEVGNDSTPIVAITQDGKMLVGDRTVAQLKKDNVTEAMTYIATLVRNGKAVTDLPNEGTSPRTMIGQRSNGAIVFVVLDSKLPGGRIAATLEEAQQVMINLDCLTAVNLDGGKSTTMYLNGEVINNPSNALGERTIASGFIVK